MKNVTFEVVEVTPTRFQVNELRPNEKPVFVGLRETRAEAEAAVERLKMQYANVPYSSF